MMAMTGFPTGLAAGQCCHRRRRRRPNGSALSALRRSTSGFQFDWFGAALPIVPAAPAIALGAAL
jgi:hypothetical protein